MYGKCDRCLTSTNITTGSYFNTEMVCNQCSKSEKNHPDFEKARQIEMAEVLKGNMNFEGIGLPKDLK